MNIVKFKDQIRLGDDWFNTYYKGKYTWLVGFRYAIPFDVLGVDDYIRFEQNPIAFEEARKKSLAGKFRDILKSDIQMLIDIEGTDKANDISEFKRFNKFTTDDDITIDELKKFRTWLATVLLAFDQDTGGHQKNQFYDENFTHVLQYYAGGMWDDTLKWISTIVPYTPSVSNNVVPSSGCGCSKGDLSSLYNINITDCNAKALYQKAMYDAMCAKFGDMNFWLDFPPIFLTEFKEYIDNIIRVGLPLTRSSYIDVYKDCSCQGEDGSYYTEMLKSLSKSLEHIINDEVNGNKNFIGDSFNRWATLLYENMEWA